MEEDLTCAICQTMVDQILQLDCPHQLCLQCASKIFVQPEGSVKCLICKTTTLINIQASEILADLARQYRKQKSAQKKLSNNAQHHTSYSTSNQKMLNSTATRTIQKSNNKNLSPIQNNTTHNNNNDFLSDQSIISKKIQFTQNNNMRNNTHSLIDKTPTRKQMSENGYQSPYAQENLNNYSPGLSKSKKQQIQTLVQNQKSRTNSPPWYPAGKSSRSPSPSPTRSKRSINNNNSHSHRAASPTRSNRKNNNNISQQQQMLMLQQQKELQREIILKQQLLSQKKQEQLYSQRGRTAKIINPATGSPYSSKMSRQASGNSPSKVALASIQSSARQSPSRNASQENFRKTSPRNMSINNSFTQQQQKFCREHIESEAHLYCATCLDGIQFCIDCHLQGLHRGHEVKNIKNAQQQQQLNNSFSQKIQQQQLENITNNLAGGSIILNSLQPQVDNMRAELKGIYNDIQQKQIQNNDFRILFKQQLQQTKIGIVKHFQDLKDALDLQQQNVLQNFDDQFVIQLQQFDEMQTKYQEQVMLFKDFEDEVHRNYYDQKLNQNNEQVILNSFNVQSEQFQEMVSKLDFYNQQKHAGSKINLNIAGEANFESQIKQIRSEIQHIKGPGNGNSTLLEELKKNSNNTNSLTARFQSPLQKNTLLHSSSSGQRSASPRNNINSINLASSSTKNSKNYSNLKYSTVQASNLNQIVSERKNLQQSSRGDKVLRDLQNLVSSSPSRSRSASPSKLPKSQNNLSEKIDFFAGSDEKSKAWYFQKLQEIKLSEGVSNPNVHIKTKNQVDAVSLLSKQKSLQIDPTYNLNSISKGGSITPTKQSSFQLQKQEFKSPIRSPSTHDTFLSNMNSKYQNLEIAKEYRKGFQTPPPLARSSPISEVLHLKSFIGSAKKKHHGVVQDIESDQIFRQNRQKQREFIRETLSPSPNRQNRDFGITSGYDTFKKQHGGLAAKPGKNGTGYFNPKEVSLKEKLSKVRQVLIQNNKSSLV